MVAYTYIKKCIPQKHIRASNLLCRFIRVGFSVADQMSVNVIQNVKRVDRITYNE